MKRTSLPLHRRAFITLLGAATAAWPLTARAQRGEKMRRIGVLVGLGADDSQAHARNAAFLQGLGERGWIVGRNLQIDYRWGGGNARRYRRQAAELVALAPELIVAMGGSVVGPLLQTTRTVPLVFLQVTDPVSSGYVASLARPGGNATGFALFESGISAKWLELLKEIAPRVTRAAVLRDPTVPVGLGQLGAIQSLAPSLKVDISPLGVRDARDIEHAITAFARGSSDGLIVLPSVPTVIHRTLIVTLAAQRKLPAVYPYRFYAAAGGLICYGPDEIEQYRQAAGYVDRILKGEKPSDLPVQTPTKFEMVINLKTAKTLDLQIPSTVLARADGVIE